MFQELLGGASLIGGERKPSISNPFEGSPSPSPSPSPCSSTTTGSATPASSSTAADNQNLRCPRCDSANTKFCYYNNYNLTQPRHFCKTCRRYWTKGGALRNVPIGGGCRKNKSIVSVTSSVNGKTSGGGRFMKAVSSEMGKPGLGGGGFDQEIPLNPVLWASSAQNSHLMALLRATQNPNPNPSPLSNFIGSHLTSGSESMGASEALSSSSSFWRNNQNQNHQNHLHQQQQQQQKMGLVVGEVQNSGFQDIYQRLRSTANYYPAHDHSVPLLFTTSSSSSSTILDSAPVAAAEMGYWNPMLTWSDLQTTNAAYP